MEEIESVVALFRDMSRLGEGEILPLSLHLMKRGIEGLIVPKMKTPDEYPLLPMAAEAHLMIRT